MSAFEFLKEKDQFTLNQTLQAETIQTLIGVVVDAGSLVSWYEGLKAPQSKAKAKKVYKAAKAALKDKGIDFHSDELD